MKITNKARVSIELQKTINEIKNTNDTDFILYDKISTINNPENLVSIDIQNTVNKSKHKISEMVLRNFCFGHSIDFSNFQKSRFNKKGGNTFRKTGYKKFQHFETRTTLRTIKDKTSNQLKLVLPIQRKKGIRTKNFSVETNSQNNISQNNNSSYLETGYQSDKQSFINLPIVDSPSPKKKKKHQNIFSSAKILPEINDNTQLLRRSLSHQKQMKCLNMKTIDTFLTNCKQGIVSSSKISNAINEYSQKRIKFNQKKYDYFIKGQRQKEEEDDLLHFNENKYTTKPKNQNSHCSEVEKLDKIKKISNHIAYTDRKVYFADIENFSSDEHFVFNKEVFEVQKKIFQEQKRKKFLQKETLNKSIDKVLKLLENAQKYKDSVLSQ